MKNRNIPYYVAALMLAAGVSTSFVSCVDTDEPETVTKLRQAAIEKIQADADLQKAYAEVQRAVVTKTNADAELVKAKAAVKAATAKEQELKNAVKEAGLDNEKEAAIQTQLEAAENARKLALDAKQAADTKAATAAADLKHAIAEALKAYANDGNTAIEKAYKDYLDKVEAYGQAQDEYVEKTTTAKKDLAELTLEVTAQTTKLAKAKEAKADVEAVYQTDDYKAWETNYKTAKEELVKAETKVTTLLEEKEETKAKLVKKKIEISSELSNWKNTQAAYEFEIKEALAKKLKLTGDEKAPFEIAKVANENPKITVQYQGGKFRIFIGEDDDATSLIKNGDAETILSKVANATQLAEYKEKGDYDYKVEQASYNAQKKAYDEGIAQTVMTGTGKDTDPDKVKNGLSKYFSDTYAAWQKDETTKEDNTLKTAYLAAAAEFLGADGDGKVDGIVLNGVIPATAAKVLADYKAAVEAHATTKPWGQYGVYLYEKEQIEKAASDLAVYKDGIALWNAINDKKKEVVAAQAAQEDANADKLASDKDYLALQTELNGVQAKINAANADVDKYKAIANAVKIALGAKTPKQKETWGWVTDYARPIYQPMYADASTPAKNKDSEGRLLDDNGNIIYSNIILSYYDKYDLIKSEDVKDEDGNTVYNSTISENIDIESIKKDVLSKLQKAIDDAQADLDAAEEDVKQYNAGNRDSNAAVARAKAKVEEKKLEMDNAKAYYDNLVKLYADKTE